MCLRSSLCIMKGADDDADDTRACRSKIILLSYNRESGERRNFVKPIWIGLGVLPTLVLTASCAFQHAAEGPTAAPGESTAKHAATQETTTTRYQINPLQFTSLDQLVDSSDVILIGSIDDATIARLDLTAAGVVEREIPMEANISSFMIHVTRVIKGYLAAGSILKIDARLGGEADGFVEIYDPPLPVPIAGGTYLFFLTTPEAFKEKTHFQTMFCGSFDGFYRLENGTVIPQHANAVIRGMPLDDLERAMGREMAND